MTTQPTEQDLPNGPVAAVLIAGGLGSAGIGLMSVLSEASVRISNALNWWNPAGPLSGKTGVGVIVFFVSWFVLHLIFRGKDLNLPRVSAVALILLGLGLLGTFPPFFNLFAAR